MSIEIKKPTKAASEMTVAKYLMQQFPEWEEQLKKLVHAYEMPFQHFCEKEAEYRLGELGISDTIHDYSSMVELVANELFNSETFTDGDVADQITSSVLDKDFCLDLKDDKQVTFLKENYFQSELLLTLSGPKSDTPWIYGNNNSMAMYISRFICMEYHTCNVITSIAGVIKCFLQPFYVFLLPCFNINILFSGES